MRIELDKNIVTFTPESDREKASLEHVWQLLIDCNGASLKLAPIGEYAPLKGVNGASFYIEGLADGKPVGKVRATEDCRVYCSICNRIEDVKAGMEIPTCCGRPMEIVD